MVQVVIVLMPKETVIIEALVHIDNQHTYEEDLELEEQMGRVGSRLSEKTIMRHLKRRRYDATSKRMGEEADICVICQGEYEKYELIGGLQCRHEYHVECVKKWLKQHNSCPIYKAAAVPSNA
ncbi:Ring finger protein [Heracleum sosnowskyi]|uniref:RING-type E3 ubiquitin transferase n=1 Tax=Heracleum sosnowskyi TaxID=360622 RepID=A0AAD8M4Z2_9APIA|nr:Ring finger protein [Heracleum sosnowskyi]